MSIYQLPTTEDLYLAQSDPSGVEDPSQWQGLLGWWPFPQNSADDFSGRGNHGTRAGASGAQNLPQWTASPGLWLPTAMNFDGTDDYVDAGTGASLAFTKDTPFSVAAWVKTSQSGSHGVLVSKYTGDGVSAAAGYLFSNLSGALLLQLQTNATTYIYRYGGAIADGVWHHVVGTYDGSSAYTGIHLYIDAVEVASYNNGASGALGSIATASETSLGRRGATGAGTNLYYAGQQADSRVYARVLSVADTRRLYEDGGAIVRRRRRTWFVPASTMPEPSGYRHWLRRRTTIIGGGLR